MANPGQRVEVFPAFHFEVMIGGDAYPFRSVSGLSSETRTYEIEEGGVNSHVHKLPGQTTFGPLCLRRGFCSPASPLYTMYLKFIMQDGSPSPRFDGSIRQLGPNGTSAKWIFKSAWISKWTGPELDATRNEVSIEAIEISHEGLYLVPGGAPAASGNSGVNATVLGANVGGNSSAPTSTSSTGTNASSTSPPAARPAYVSPSGTSSTYASPPANTNPPNANPAPSANPAPNANPAPSANDGGEFDV
jgi:phage tail-like protein